MRPVLFLTFLCLGFAFAADEKPSPEVEKLIKLLKSTNFDSQVNALKKLGDLGEKAKPALKPIFELYTTTKSTPLQKKSLEAVEAIHPTLHKLTLEFRKDNDEARIDALTKLNEHEESDIKPMASIVVNTANRERLRTNGESVAMDLYFEVIAKHFTEEKETKTLFLESITFVPGKPRGYAARRSAMEHVATINIDKKLLHKALVSALVERDHEIREKCCVRLGELGAVAKPSLTILRQLSRTDPDEDVRTAATMAVKFIEMAK